jgi:hypothetical protein
MRWAQALETYGLYRRTAGLKRLRGRSHHCLPPSPRHRDSVEERIEEECSPTKRGPIPEGTGPG